MGFADKIENEIQRIVIYFVKIVLFCNNFPKLLLDFFFLAFVPGWFDPWALLTGLKMKCKDLGVHFVEGEVYNIAHEVNEQKIWEDTIEDEIEDETL